MGLDDFSSPLLSLSRVVVFYCEVDGCVNHLCVNAADFRGVLGQPVKQTTGQTRATRGAQ